MNWNPGRPTASNDRWSVPPVFLMVMVVAPSSRNGASQVSNSGRIASFSCKYTPRILPLPLSDRKSTRLNSGHRCMSYAVFCLKKKFKYCFVVLFGFIYIFVVSLCVYHVG